MKNMCMIECLINSRNRDSEGIISYVVIWVLTSLLLVLSLTFSIVLVNYSTVRNEEVLTTVRYACEKGVAWSLACIYKIPDKYIKIPQMGESLIIEDDEIFYVAVVGEENNTLLVRAIHKISGLSAQTHITYSVNLNNGQGRVNSIKDY